jgi:hypothetical protein
MGWIWHHGDDASSSSLRHVDAGWQPEPRPDQAWAHFRGWRINYEAAAYLLANHLDAPPALWSGPRRHPVQPMAPTRPLHTLDE